MDSAFCWGLKTITKLECFSVNHWESMVLRYLRCTQTWSDRMLKGRSYDTNRIMPIHWWFLPEYDVTQFYLCKPLFHVSSRYEVLWHALSWILDRCRNGALLIITFRMRWSSKSVVTAFHKEIHNTATKLFSIWFLQMQRQSRDAWRCNITNIWRLWWWKNNAHYRISM